MLNEFFIFLQLGFQHICSIMGLDHILFVVVLCAAYRLEDWKKIVLLATGFTLGHSVTLALSALDLVQLPEGLIEALIPMTILLTSALNLFNAKNQAANLETRSATTHFGNNSFFLALFFGLIHGLGFSYYFKALLGEGEHIFQPLFAFNVGLELGQILIILIILSIYALFTRWFKGQHRDWVLVVSGMGAGIALKLLLG
jgi:HupE / UreJ protein